MSKNTISPDGTKKFVSEECRDSMLRIRSVETDEVIHEREDNGGYHWELDFSEDGNKVIYLTHCRHGYINPCITVWGFESGEIWNVRSKHHRAVRIARETHNKDFSIVVLADRDGYISLVRPYEEGVVWHQRPVAKEKLELRGILISEKEGVVWVEFNIAIVALSITDGKVQS